MLEKLLFFIIGVAAVFIACFIWSSNFRAIKYRYLVQTLAIQIVLAFVLLQSSAGIWIIVAISDAFNYILQYSNVGTNVVFGDLNNMSKNGFVFFFQVGMPIVIMSAIIGILQYIKILPWVMKGVGYALSKVNGLGKLESFNAISSLTVGQSENFIIYRNIIDKLPKNVLYTMAATAMSTVSMAIVGSYMTIIDPHYVCIALVMNIFSVFFVLHVINPYDPDKNFSYADFSFSHTKHKQSFFEMLSDYILVGFKIAIIVSVMLIGFNALMALLNGIFVGSIGVSFQDIVGYIFYPIAWILNIPSSDLLVSGQIMGTKIATNEFVAMQMLSDNQDNLNPYTIKVISIFLVSFANIGSIGIIIGGVKAVSDTAAIEVAKFGLKILYGAACVSLLSAIIIGLFI